jgi:GT2 family glycosyltransferase/glycosyltransferase involved in cell wall biosynthesis
METPINKSTPPAILIIDATLPTYDQDSGSLRLITLIKMLLTMGCQLSFFSYERRTKLKYQFVLEALGVEVLKGKLQQLLVSRQFNCAWICRVHTAHYYIPIIRLMNPDAKIFFDTVDIHYIRELRQAEIEDNPAMADKALKTKRKELSSCLLADRVITVTAEDGQHLQKELPQLSFSVIPNIHQQHSASNSPFEQREGLVFIGHYRHKPNQDAMSYFVTNILPKIHAHLPDVKLYIVGSYMITKVSALASEHVKVIGWVDKVEPEFAKYRVFVSPLRYGAGMKGKLGQALSLGLPIVTTTVGAEGMGLTDGETALIVDDEESFAKAVCRLYTDSILWKKLAHQGKAYIEEHFGAAAVYDKLCQLLAEFQLLPEVRLEGKEKTVAGPLHKSCARVQQVGKKKTLPTLHKSCARVQYNLPTPDFPILPEFIKTSNFNSINSIQLPDAQKPRVSIIIPVFNQALYTYNCLLTVQACDQEISKEVIIINNASTDETETLLAQLEGAFTIINNSENQGFVQACLQGVKVAKGEFIVFLNNDTQVTPGWLSHMLKRMDTDSEVGITGAQLIYPSGQLQEAGSIIFNDGSGYNYGRSQNPLLPQFNQSREVDYCSGACLMVRKNLYEQLGGFDVRYAPAYYEDTDLCFSARKAGYKVFYCHESQVIHHEGVTAGKDINSGYKAFQAINQKKFVEKWQDILTTHYPPGTPIQQAITRLTFLSKKHAQSQT